MNRLAMRTLLRRRLQDESASPEWDDPEGNVLLNLGLVQVQIRIMEVDPYAFLSIDTFDIVSGQERYTKPIDGEFLFEIDLAILDSDQATGWRSLERQAWGATRRRVTGSPVVYSSMGKWFFLSPIPSASVNEGLRLIWAYGLSMSSDDDVPLIPLPLQDCIVDEAVVKALGETSETEAAQTAIARLERAYAHMPMWYRRSRVPTGIQPLVRDARTFLALPRDVYRTS